MTIRREQPRWWDWQRGTNGRGRTGAEGGNEVDRRYVLRAGALALTGVLAGCGDFRQGDAGTTNGLSGADEDPVQHDEFDAGSAPPRTAERDEPDVDAPEPELEPADEPEPIEVALEVICRDALGLAAAAGAGRTHRIRQLTLHHTAAKLGTNRHAPDRLRGHQRYHLDQGWPDIAYHYAVDLRGNIYELRDPATAGDTFTDYDPAGHFLVVCEGNYNHEHPTDAMLGGVADVLAYGADEHSVGLDTLTGHRDHVSGISCPGDHLYERLGELRAEATRRRAQGRRYLVSVCGEPGRARVERIQAG